MSEAGDAHPALTQLDALLTLAETAPLDRGDCLRINELVALAPGRLQRVVEAFARQRDAAAVEALLALPHGTRGVVEAVYAALRHGVTRHDPVRGPYPRMCALEFRSSSSRRFPALVARASAAFGAGLERIRVADKLHYRFALFEDHPAKPSLRQRAAPLELDLLALHRDLGRLKGTRVWLNGWLFDDDSPLRQPARAALLHAWFEWALSEGPGGARARP